MRDAPVPLSLALVPVSLVATLAAAATPSPAWAQGRENFSDSGTFEIRLSHQSMGTETFRISGSSAGWETSADLVLKAGETSSQERATLRLSATLRPEEYLREQTSPQVGSVAAHFGPKETSLVSVTQKESNERVFYLPEYFLVVLDTNFFHQYTLLLRQYARSQGGPQPFNVFIPQEALPGTVYLEWVKRENSLDHWKITTDQLEMEILASEPGAIQHISIPGADLEIVRK